MTAPTAERIREIRAHAVILREHLPADNIAANDTHDLLAALDHVAEFLRDRLERVPLEGCTCDDCTEMSDLLAYIDGGKP